MISWTNFNASNNFLNFDLKRKGKEPQLYGIEAALYNIDYITKNYPEPYTLYLSGGSDSQAMLYAWVKSGKPFRTFSGVYNFRSNWYDLETCSNFAKQLGIDITYHDFDLINFLETEHHNYAIKYKTGSPQFTAFIKMASMTKDGTVIFSGECTPPKHYVNPKSPPMAIPSLNELGLYYYGIIENKPIVPWFFIETETMAYSWKYENAPTYIPSYSSQDIEIIQENKRMKKGYNAKISIYHQNGYPVIPQNDKMNGFEQIKIYYDTNSPRKPNMQDKMHIGFEGSKRNFDLLYRNKYESKISHYIYNLTW